MTPAEDIAFVISLGTACPTAQAIEDAGLRRFSSPFDWLFSNADMVAACIRDDFSQFLSRAQWQCCGARNEWTHPFFQQNCGSGLIILHHDISNDADFGSLSRAVDRFRQVLADPRPKLFVTMIGVEWLAYPGLETMRSLIREATASPAFLTIGIRPKQQQAELVEHAVDGDTRTVEFAPSSEFEAGRRYSAPGDNTLLRSVFDAYRINAAPL
ncbi:hypothetical protein FHR90_000243 [Endobacter medicaginis]|uniref:Uncharacterized protein n=1 Tax=Endobacter medicaginis TaxID=1181271 RepID=A0A850NIP0_9PROT|nr:DUF1796 family putative cysteine peptidase [Endobacter medicaginis]MBB3172437.1 hypothetical protein [Endobacter medicaginis]MCX5474074.1 DUF1796 family putative cysteine peptidase [Endobacter medicaginis]NVN29503.1 hypothetical protein [Endobacter medicaginis]